MDIPDLFLLHIYFFSNNFKILLTLSGIRTQIVGVEGEHADHLTTSTAQQLPGKTNVCPKMCTYFRPTEPKTREMNRQHNLALKWKIQISVSKLPPKHFQSKHATRILRGRNARKSCARDHGQCDQMTS